MRTLFLVLIVLLSAALPVSMQTNAQAQPEATPTAVPPAAPSSTLSDAERLDLLERRMDDIAERADGALDTAFNLLGLFEFVSGAIGLIVPFLAITGALIGFRRLQAAEEELRQARIQFEENVAEKERSLDILREQLEATANSQRQQLEMSMHSQRETSSKAALALSLLPLGERQYRAQDYTGALDTYQRAFDLDPNNPVIYYRMGYVYTQSGELEKAEQFLTRALELDPGLTAARAALGYVYRRKGDKMADGIDRDLTYNKAEENLLEALKAAPKLMDEDSESWWGSLGGLYRRRGQDTQAIDAYKKATQVTPHSSYPFSNLALLYMQTNKRDQMVETYRRVERLAYGEIQAESSNYWAHADLITARLALGKLDQIDELLRQTLEAAPPDSPYTLESLTDTLTRLAGVLEPQEVPPVSRVVGQIRAFIQSRTGQLTAISAD